MELQKPAQKSPRVAETKIIQREQKGMETYDRHKAQVVNQ
jgi:hypothetical protein